MKKVRMILTATVVFAVVGSALAFKAHKTSNVYCGANGTTAGIDCPLLQQTDFSADENGTTFCTRVPGTICNTKATTFFSAH